jgi:hypothetical protein
VSFARAQQRSGDHRPVADAPACHSGGGTLCVISHHTHEADFRYNSFFKEFWAMQSLFIQSLTSAAVPSGKKRSGNQLFTSVSPATSNRWPSFIISIGIHVLGLLLVPPVTHQLAEQSDRELWIRQERLLRTLRIRIPEQLYIASSGSNSTLEKKRVVLRPEKSLPARVETGGLESARRRRPPRRRFELPPLPRRTDTPHTILQPQYAPDMLPSAAINLPEVFFWSPQSRLPRFVQPFKMPGYETKPTQARVLDAPPKLEVPAWEPGAMNVPPVPDSLAVLRILAGPVLPIRTSAAENPAPHTGVSAEPASGDPTTLLSLALDPQRMREFLSLPPGNQLGRMPDAGTTGRISATLAGSGSDEAGAAGSKGTGAADTTAAGTGSGAASTSGRTGTAAPGGAPADPLAPENVRATAIAAAAATRVLHAANGVFDVVVQSSGLEGFPESAGVLSGKPIYSAFVRAGGAKDWILQYCIPAAEDRSAVVSGPIVTLGNNSPLTAPYPRVTLRPAVKQRPGRYVMVHGTITAAGRFQDLRILGVTDPYETEVVLGVLEQWEFRPAMRDGQAVKVEILLAIPAE